MRFMFCSLEGYALVSADFAHFTTVCNRKIVNQFVVDLTPLCKAALYCTVNSIERDTLSLRPFLGFESIPRTGHLNYHIPRTGQHIPRTGHPV